MATHLDRATVTAALHDAWDGMLALGAELDENDWRTPSLCPGWTVKDLYSHVIGTESMLLGRDAPAVEVGDRPHIRNDIGRFNETWVVANEQRSGSDVLADLEAVISERRAALDALSDEAWDEVDFTPVGKDTHGRFMRIRTFDVWIHEYDARVPLGRPGHLSGPAVEATLDEIGNALGYVVGKLAGAPKGSAVRIQVTGPSERTYDVAVDERAALVDALDREPDATIRLPLEPFISLVGARTDADPTAPSIQLHGDRGLGERVVANLGYLI